MRVKYSTIYAAPFVQTDDEPKPITECQHGNTWECRECEAIEYWQERSELFDRSVFQVGIPLED